MDPVSVITAAAYTAKSAKELYKFIKSAGSVNETVTNLAKDINAYGETCTRVQSTLTTLKASYPSQTSHNSSLESLRIKRDNLVWEDVQNRLEECQDIIDNLWAATKDVREEKSGLAARAIQQLKLNIREGDIVAIQARLQHHTSLLSLSFNATTIEVQNLIPRHVDNEMLGRLKKIQRILEVYSRDQAPADAQNTVIQYAKRVFDDAATLCRASVAGDTIADTIESLTIKELTQPERDQIQHWRDDVSFSERDPESPDPKGSRDSIFSTASKSPSVFTEDTSLDSRSTSLEHSRSSTHKFFCKIVNQLIAIGSTAFSERKYEEAHSMLSNAEDELQRLSLQQSPDFDWADLQYKLAVCEYDLQRHAAAADRLITFKSQFKETESETHRADVYRAEHLLAQIYICLGKIELALCSCKKACPGRMELLGEENPDYYRSVVLMARTYELMGNTSMTKGLLHNIPSASLAELVAQYADLKPLQENAESISVFRSGGIQSETSLPTKLESTRERKIAGLRSAKTKISLITRTRSEPVQEQQSANSAISLDKALKSPGHRGSEKEIFTGHNSRRGSADYSIRSAPQPAAPSPSDNAKRKVWLSAFSWKPKGKIQCAIAEARTSEALGLISNLPSSKKGSKENLDDAFLMAVLLGNVGIAATLLQHGASVNASRKVGHSIGEGRRATALHVAAAAQRPEMIKFLANNGFTVRDLLLLRESIFSFLFDADMLRLCGGECPAQLLTTLDALKRARVDLNAADSNGWTALHWAAAIKKLEYSYLHANATSSLLGHGANVMRASKAGQIPLHIAVASPHGPETVEILLTRHGLIQVQTVDKTSRTPLEIAMEQCVVSKAVVEKLLAAGADPDVKNGRLFNIAYQRGEHEGLVDLLEKYSRRRGRGYE